MGILDSNIGYQIGLLAGGLWAERYRERGAEKLLQQETAEEPHLNRDLANRYFHNTMSQNSPAYRFFTNDHPWNNTNNTAPNTFQANILAPLGQTTPTKPYTPPTNLLRRR